MAQPTGIRTEIREFRTQNTRVLNAMREDVNDLRGDVNDLRTRVETGFAEVETGFIEIRGRLDAAAAGQQQIVGLLNRLLVEGDTPAP